MLADKKYKFWLIEDDMKNGHQNQVIEHFPSRIMFDLTSRCNLNCWHCSKKEDHEPASDAPRELIDFVLNNIISRARYLRIGGVGIGEMLLANDFEYFLKKLDKNKLDETHLVTNLTILDDSKAELIVNKIDNVEISLEGTGSFYSRIRGVPWDVLIKNITCLNHVRHKAQGLNPQITLLVCSLLSHLKDLYHLFELKEVGVDKIIFREYYPTSAKNTHECLWQNAKHVRNWITTMENLSLKHSLPIEILFKARYQNDAPSINPPKERLRKCFFPWDGLSINSQGFISSCCADLQLGRIRNYNDDIFKQINNSSFRNLRKFVNSTTPLRDCLRCESKNPYASQTNLTSGLNRFIARMAKPLQK